jgi:hypothetical protein
VISAKVRSRIPSFFSLSDARSTFVPIFLRFQHDESSVTPPQTDVRAAWRRAYHVLRLRSCGRNGQHELRILQLWRRRPRDPLHRQIHPSLLPRRPLHPPPTIFHSLPFLALRYIQQLCRHLPFQLFLFPKIPFLPLSPSAPVRPRGSFSLSISLLSSPSTSSTVRFSPFLVASSCPFLSRD